MHTHLSFLFNMPAIERLLQLPEKPKGLPHSDSPLQLVCEDGLQYPNYTLFKLLNPLEKLFIDRELNAAPKKYNCSMLQVRLSISRLGLEWNWLTYS